MKHLQPPDWPSPRGYSNGVVASGDIIFVGGQIGWDEREEIVSDDLVDQIRQALRNIVAVLSEAEAGPEHLTRLSWYIVDKQDYLQRQREVGQAYREVLGKNFPPMTLVEVQDLLEEGALVEIEATAVRPR